MRKVDGLGAEQGRVKVNPDLSVPGHPKVFAIGDMALVLRENAEPVPGVSPAAMQMARHVARIITHELDKPVPGRGRVLASPNSTENPQAQADQGSRGRSPAVAWVGRFHFSGWFAWLTWLGVHLIFLLGFRNKVAVLLQWTYSYFAYKRGARIITQQPDTNRTETMPTHAT